MRHINLIHRQIRLPSEYRPILDAAVETGMFMDLSDALLFMMRSILFEKDAKAVHERYVAVKPSPYEEFFTVTIRMPRGLPDIIEKRDWSITRLAVLGIETYSKNEHSTLSDSDCR